MDSSCKSYDQLLVKLLPDPQKEGERKSIYVNSGEVKRNKHLNKLHSIVAHIFNPVGNLAGQNVSVPFEGDIRPISSIQN